MGRQLVRTVGILFLSSLVTVAADIGPAWGNEGPEQPIRQIPGINAEDHFPRGCVDCHINMPEKNMDVRLSTLMARWVEGVGPEFIDRIKAAGPTGLQLKGRHPVATAALQDIPAGCVTCHEKGAKTAPPFAEMMHLIHLVGGEENHFMALFQGECTYCHKFEENTGKWSVPSGLER